MEVLSARGDKILIDRKSLPKLLGRKICSLAPSKVGIKYSIVTINKKNVYVHRLVMDCPRHTQVDHINRNGLDNRIKNLRICTGSQNMAHTPLRRKSRSGYRGVVRKGNSWSVKIRNNNKEYYLGSFNSLINAARAYDLEAIKMHGEFATLNFKKMVGV